MERPRYFMVLMTGHDYLFGEWKGWCQYLSPLQRLPGYPNKNSNNKKIESTRGMIRQLNSKNNGPVCCLWAFIQALELLVFSCFLYNTDGNEWWVWIKSWKSCAKPFQVLMLCMWKSPICKKLLWMSVPPGEIDFVWFLLHTCYCTGVLSNEFEQHSD